MFHELNSKEAESSIKDKTLRAWRSFLIAIGRVDAAKEEADKIDSYGYVENRRYENVLTVDSEQEFIAALKKAGATSVEAQVYITKDKSKENLGAYAVYNHDVTFVAALPGLKSVRYPVSFDKHRSPDEADYLPITDTLALRTYLTAGQSLINLKMGFPNILTSLLTSNKGIKFDGNYYYDMVQTAMNRKVHAWK